MKPEQQIIAIAEACGWRKKMGGWVSPDNAFFEEPTFPDYIQDLNAMHEAEDHIPDKYDLYEEFLKKRLGDEWGYATAAQRAEAFLRTLGLWEDGQ